MICIKFNDKQIVNYKQIDQQVISIPRNILSNFLYNDIVFEYTYLIPKISCNYVSIIKDMIFNSINNIPADIFDIIKNKDCDIVNSFIKNSNDIIGNFLNDNTENNQLQLYKNDKILILKSVFKSIDKQIQEFKNIMNEKKIDILSMVNFFIQFIENKLHNVKSIQQTNINALVDAQQINQIELFNNIDCHQIIDQIGFFYKQFILFNYCQIHQNEKLEINSNQITQNNSQLVIKNE